MPTPRIAKHIQVGVVTTHVGWIVEYEDGETQAFSFDLPTTRAFIQALEQAADQLTEIVHAPSFRDSIGIGEDVQLRLTDPEDG